MYSTGKVIHTRQVLVEEPEQQPIEYDEKTEKESYTVIPWDTEYHVRCYSSWASVDK